MSDPKTFIADLLAEIDVNGVIGRELAAHPPTLQVAVSPDDPRYAEAVAFRDYVQAQFDAKSAEEWAADWASISPEVLRELARTYWGL